MDKALAKALKETEPLPIKDLTVRLNSDSQIIAAHFKAEYGTSISALVNLAVNHWAKTRS